MPSAGTARSSSKHEDPARVTFLLIPESLACICPCTPEAFFHLWHGFQLVLSPAGTKVACFEPYGREHTTIAALPRHVIIVPDSEKIWSTEPAWNLQILQDCSFSTHGAEGGLLVLPDSAIHVWLEFPWHLLEGYGWNVRLPPHPSAQVSLQVTLVPRRQGALLPLPALRVTCVTCCSLQPCGPRQTSPGQQRVR